MERNCHFFCRGAFFSLLYFRLLYKRKGNLSAKRARSYPPSLDLRVRSASRAVCVATLTLCLRSRRFTPTIFTFGEEKICLFSFIFAETQTPRQIECDAARREIISRSSLLHSNHTTDPEYSCQFLRLDNSSIGASQSTDLTQRTADGGFRFVNRGNAAGAAGADDRRADRWFWF